MSAKYFLDIRDPNVNLQLEALTKAINGEDPLPCALLCAAYIDKCLQEILELVFVKGGTAKSLLKPDRGLLGGLRNRAQIAYLMGRIEDTVLTNIERICEIRNLFAHSHEPLTFDSESVVKLCDLIKPPVPHVTVSDIPESEFAELNRMLGASRFRFTSAAINCLTHLIFVALQLRNEKTDSERRSS